MIPINVDKWRIHHRKVALMGCGYRVEQHLNESGLYTTSFLLTRALHQHMANQALPSGFLPAMGYFVQFDLSPLTWKLRREVDPSAENTNPDLVNIVTEVDWKWFNWQKSPETTEVKLGALSQTEHNPDQRVYHHLLFLFLPDEMVDFVGEHRPKDVL